MTGSLTLDGITLDGHAKAVTGGKQEVVADGVTAKAPLITVAADGLLTTDNGARLQNNANSGDGGAVANSGTFRMDGGSITRESCGKRRGRLAERHLPARRERAYARDGPDGLSDGGRRRKDREGHQR